MSVKKLLQEKDLFNSRLEVEISGKEIDHVIINTLRRIILSEVPVFCWDEFEITKNESIYNNSQLRLFLRNIPVVGITDIPKKVPKNKKLDDIDEEDEEMEQDLKGMIGMDDIDTEDKVKVDGSSLNQMSFYLDYHNKTNEIVSVTTDNAQFYYQGKEIKSPYSNPVILIKLQPSQQITLTAKTRLSNEKDNGRFSATSLCAFNELDKNKYKFFLESRGLYSEKDLLVLACELINKKMERISKIFPETDIEEGEIRIPKEDYTIGNIFSHGLNQLEEVGYATHMKKHPLDNEIFIKVGLKKSSSMKKLIDKVVKNYSEVFNKLSKEFSKI
jgi:DNA-directed RNA polymerase subunit L